MQAKSHTFLSGATATGASGSIQPNNRNKVFQAYGAVSASTGAATIVIEGSIDDSNWETVDTLSLTLGTSVTSDFGTDSASWKHVRARVSAISGTNAAVTVTMSTQE